MERALSDFVIYKIIRIEQEDVWNDCNHWKEMIELVVGLMMITDLRLVYIDSSGRYEECYPRLFQTSLERTEEVEGKFLCWD